MLFIGKKTGSEEEQNCHFAYAALPYKKQIKQLSEAFEKRQFTLFLQPKVSLADWSIQGVELLLRWQHPSYGMLLPEQFKPQMEESGLIEKLAPWLLRRACKLNTHWQDNGLNPLNISLNMPCTQLLDTNFQVSVDEIITKYEIDAHLLEFEITDNCLFENIDSQFRTFQNLRSRGIRLALKYSISGLPIAINLSELPIDVINISKDLTHQISNNRENRQIMSTILSFAHENKLEVVAEGVETAEQLIFLNAMHCNIAQGFLLSPPLSANKFTALYQSGKKFDTLVDKVSIKRP